MSLTITFDTGYRLKCSLRTGSIVDSWCRLLDHELARGTLLHEDTYASLQSPEHCWKLLQQSAHIINTFARRELITVPDTYHDLDQDYYNRLHSEFERVSGPDWDSSTRFMKIAPESVRRAVRSVNRLCHVMESRSRDQCFRVEFDTVHRIALEQHHFAEFSMPEPNTLTVDYSTLGKNLLECFADGLSPSYAAYQPQRHVSANFVLRGNMEPWPMTQLREWLDAHDSPVALDATTVGVITLGDIEDPDWFDSVKQTSKIHTIILE